MTIYAFLYCDSTPESAAETISLHLTEKGAHKAMIKHRWAQRVQHREFGLDRGKWPWKYDDSKSWGIKEMEVLE